MKPTHPEETPQGYLDAEGLLKALWPDKASRPSLRFLRSLQAKRAIPYLKVSRSVFFEAERVREALHRFEVKPLEQS